MTAIEWLELAKRDIKTNPDMAVKYINEAIILIKKFGDVIKKVNKEGI